MIASKYNGSQCISSLYQIQLLADLNLKKTPQLAEIVAGDSGKVCINFYACIFRTNYLHAKELNHVYPQDLCQHMDL